MKLWTWQKKDFSLTNAEKPIDSRTHSDYYIDYKDQLERLWDTLETTQFIWCYTEKEDVFSEASKRAYKNHVLWELDVPDDLIFKNPCSIAWHWILQGCRCSPPSKLKEAWRRECLNTSRQKENDWHCF